MTCSEWRMNGDATHNVRRTFGRHGIEGTARSSFGGMCCLRQRCKVRQLVRVEIPPVYCRQQRAKLCTIAVSLGESLAEDCIVSLQFVQLRRLRRQQRREARALSL
jgi:hypothetical protein